MEEVLLLEATGGGSVSSGLLVLAISDQVGLIRGLLVDSMGVLVVGFAASTDGNTSSFSTVM